MIAFFFALMSAQFAGGPVDPAGTAAPALSPARIETSNTANYTIASPRFDMHGTTMRIEGDVCRRPNDTGLSPSRIRIERIQPDGTIAATSFAFLPLLSRRPDQRCGRFGAALRPPPRPGETVRVCVAGSDACPVSH